MGLFNWFKKDNDKASANDLANTCSFLTRCLCASQFDSIFTNEYRYSLLNKEFLIFSFFKESYSSIPNYKKISDSISILKNEEYNINSGILLIINATIDTIKDMRHFVKDDVVDYALASLYDNLENGLIENIYNTIPSLNYAYYNNDYAYYKNSYFLDCANFLKIYYTGMKKQETKITITSPNYTSYILGYSNIENEKLYFKYIYELYTYCNIDIKLAIIAYFRFSLIKNSEWDETTNPYIEGEHDRKHDICIPSRVLEDFEGTESPFKINPSW